MLAFRFVQQGNHHRQFHTMLVRFA